MPFVILLHNHCKAYESIKGHNDTTNALKMMCNSPNLDRININAYTKFGKIL